MYYYADLDENGLITSLIQCSIPAENSLLFEIPSYDLSLLGRYVIDGQLGPAPSEGNGWVWNDETDSFEMVPYQTITD
jgi:hypothetical protein